MLIFLKRLNLPLLGLTGLLALFLALGLIISLNASQGPDEVAHFYFNRFVAQSGRLPLTGAERLEAGYKADLPPLYYLVTGSLARSLDLESPPRLKITRDNPRLQLVAGLKNIKGWRLIPTEDPLRGEVLLWYLGRWVSLAFGLVGVFLTWFLLRLTHPTHPWLAVGGAAVLAFLPAYPYVSSVTSYESLTGALMAGYLALLFFLIKFPERNRLYFFSGVTLGLTATARQTPWILLPFLPLLVLWLARAHGWPRHRTALRLGLVLAGLLLTFGLWVLYVSLYFNNVAQLGWFFGLLNPILIGDGSGKTSLQIAGLISNGRMGTVDLSGQGDSIWQWVWTFFTGVWGGGWLGWLMLVVWGAAVVGIGRQWRRCAVTVRLWVVILALHVALLLTFPLIRFIFSGEARSALSQHILFPAGAAMVLLLVYGLRAWLPPGRLAAALLMLAGIYLWGDATAAESQQDPSFPLQTTPLPAETVQTTFDDLAFLGHTLQADDRLLQVSLQWRAEASPNEDYRFDLTLLDAAGQPQTRWLGQPLNGRYPTRAWLPGDRVRTAFNLPIAGLPPGEYRLQLQVWGEAGPVGAVWELGAVTLTPHAPALDDVLTIGGQDIGYTLWPVGQSEPGLPLYKEYGVVTITLAQPLGAAKRLVLAGPNNAVLEPAAALKTVYQFEISPFAPGGEYRLRLVNAAVEPQALLAESPPLLRVENEPRLAVPPPISHPVSANFAGYVDLLGYDLPQMQVQPGGALAVTLYWQAAKTIGADLVLFNHLIGPDGRQWGGQDRRAQDVYSSMLWAPGEVVPDAFSVAVLPAAPPGTYYLLVGLYLPVGQASVSLPLMENGQMSQITHVAIGPIEVTSGDGGQ